MSKVDHYKKKFLGFMTPDQINEVKITDRGFVYKGNLIVAIPGLSSEIAKVIEQVEKIEPVIAQVEEIEKIENEDYIWPKPGKEKGTLVTELPEVTEDPVIQVEVKKEVVKAAPRKLNKKK